MGKYRKASEEKALRNKVYALRFQQLECENCKHRTSRPGKCVMCLEPIRSSDYARRIRKDLRS